MEGFSSDGVLIFFLLLKIQTQGVIHEKQLDEPQMQLTSEAQVCE